MSKPFFIIGGERRSGSTTLYDVLSQHSEVGMLPISDFDFFIEPELFSRKPHPQNQTIPLWEATHALEQYQALFSGLQGKTGQKDADLLWWKPTHQRLAQWLPETRFLFVLRDPVKRAESQFFNEKNKGRETQTFEEALQREEKNTLSDWEQLHLAYQSRGCYVESLQHFFKYISPSRVKVIILEEWMDQWEPIMQEICRFLEIDAQEAMNIRPFHSNKERLLVRSRYASKGMLKSFFDVWERLSEGMITRMTKSKTARERWRKYLQGFYKKSLRSQETIHPETRTALKKYYEPYNRALEALLGKEIPYW